MSRTRHIGKRMNQRGIRAAMLDVVERFGIWDGDRLVLNRQACSSAVRELDQLRKSLLDVEASDGLVLVQEKGMDITAFRLDSYRRAQRRH